MTIYVFASQFSVGLCGDVLCFKIHALNTQVAELIGIATGLERGLFQVNSFSRVLFPIMLKENSG